MSEDMEPEQMGGRNGWHGCAGTTRVSLGALSVFFESVLVNSLIRFDPQSLIGS